MQAPLPSVPVETPIDLSHLTARAKALGVSNRRELSALEAQNIAKGFIKYLAAKPSSRLAPFEYAWSLKVHHEMFCDVWQWSGKLRQFDGNIGIPYYNIGAELFGLLTDLHEWPGLNMPLLEQAARLHHRAVAIHPFPNGNGRWARLLANIWLKQQGGAPTLWPEETIGGKSEIRREYISVVKTADRGDLRLLIELHVRYGMSSA